MGKLARLYLILAQQLIIVVSSMAYWIEMAEELEVNDMGSKMGKHILVILKMLVFPK